MRTRRRRIIANLTLKSSHIDPSRTITERSSFAAYLRRIIDGLIRETTRLVEAEDAFSLVSNQRFNALTTAGKLDQFEDWLDDAVRRHIVNTETQREMGRRIRKGLTKGIERGRLQVVSIRAIGRDEFQLPEATKDNFVRVVLRNPNTEERVSLIVRNGYRDLKGITDDMSSRIARTVATGIIEGKTPKQLAADIRKVAKVSKNRASLLASDAIIRAHAEGQLDAFEYMGEEDVVLSAEWNTTNDLKVCPLCQPLDNVVMKISEARGLLPRHNRCRCAWRAVIAVPKSGTGKVSKTKVDRAIQRSVRAESKDAENVSWPGKDRYISRDRV